MFTGEGQGVLPAVDLAVEHINKDRQVLPNHRLEVIKNDTKVSEFLSYRVYKCAATLQALRDFPCRLMSSVLQITLDLQHVLAMV